MAFTRSPEFFVHPYLFEVFLQHIFHAKHGEDGFVLVVGHQLAPLGQPHGVDTLFLEGQDGHIGDGGGHNQGDEKGIAPGDLGNQEDGGQGSVHHPGHHPGHSHQGKVIFGYVCGTKHIDRLGQGGPAHPAHKEGRGKDAAYPAAAGGQSHGNHLEEDQQQEENNNEEGVIADDAFEEGAVKEFPRMARQQGAQGDIPLSEELGHQEDQYRDQQSPGQGPHQAIRDLSHGMLHQVIHPGEVKGDQSGEDSQQNVEGEVPA